MRLYKTLKERVAGKLRRPRRLLNETIPGKSWIVYKYFDVVSGLALFSSILGIIIPLFAKEINTTIKWTTGTLAIVTLSITWLAVRLSHKHGRMVDSAFKKETEIKILRDQLNTSVKTLNKNTEANQNVSYCLHNILHEMRDLFGLLFDLLDTKDKAEQQEYLHLEFERFVNHFLDNTKNIYNIITGLQCSCNHKNTYSKEAARYYYNL